MSTERLQMNFGEPDPMAEPSGLCIDCGGVAVGERFVGFIDDDEIVELVCYNHLSEV